MTSKSSRRQHASYYTHTRYSMASASNGGGSRHACGGKSTRSRIPPGVRPWLSKRLEELWGIDGQVYSHYILSVLLDGVDNEFLIDTSSSDPHRGHSQGKRQEATRASKRNRSKPKNLRSTASTTKNQHPGGLLDSSLDSDDTATSDDSSWGVDEGEGDKCEIAKAFEKRKMAVVTYLNRLAYEDNEVNSLVEELIERLGFGPERQEQAKKEVKVEHRKRNANSNKSSKLEHAEQKRFFGPPIAVNRCASLNDCVHLKHEEKARQAGWVAFKMGRNRIKKSADSGNKRDQIRKSRGRIASLDECQSVFLPKLILKGERTSSSIGPKSEDFVEKEARMQSKGPRESSRKRLSSEDSSSCDFHSENQEANFGLPLKRGMRNASSFLIDFSSDCEDGEEFFDFSISFLDSYDDLDETYNEAFPSLIETHTGQHFFALTTCQNAVSMGGCDRSDSNKEKGTFEVTVGASRVALPPNPVSKGQPVWSSKVKAPIGRPMNRKYADAEISNSIIEGANVLLTIDEVVKRSQLSESENSGEAKIESAGCPYNSYHSLLADRELDSILNMIGLTPEKVPGMRDTGGRSTESQFNFDVSESLRTFSKCTKDLFQSKNPETFEGNESECDLKKGLLSPELSKIWDRDEAERKNNTEGLEASSSLNSLTESDDQLLQSRKMSSGTINPDPVWMPTEADLGTSLNSVTRDPRANQNSLLANVEISVTVPTHEACFDLLAGFPGILLSPGIDDESSAAASQDDEKCECKNKISSSFCNCSDPDVKFPDVYFSTYNPQLFDLLDLYMLGENIGFTTNGSTDLFTLGNFYRKRDIYFDDYFAENIPSAVEQRPMSGSDSSLPPLLTEHFLMEIMKFNEQCSPSTPVGSEFDTGSLFDDRSSEVTTLQQRANSLIMRHQRMYQQTATVPDTVDAAMQTDAEQNEEEHRISPQVVTEDEPSLTNELVEPIDPISESGLVEIGTQLFASLIDQEDEVSAIDAPGAEDSSAFQFEPKLTPWSVASSSFVTESQDALTAATTTTASTVSEATTANAAKESSSKEFETFKCPAGCDPNAEPSAHHHIHGEDLLISPKTHFRPISVQSAEDEDLNEAAYDEQLTIEQTLDGLAPQGSSFLDINTEIKDSRLFTSWCKGIAQLGAEAVKQPAEIVDEEKDQSKPSGRNSEALRSIWDRSVMPADESTKEQGKKLVVNENGEVVPSLWCPNVDKNASTSNWVSSSTNHFERKSTSLTTEFESGTVPQLQEPVDVNNPYLGMNLNNPPFDIDPVEELEFVFDHEMNTQNPAFSAILSQQTPVYPTEFPVGFIPMETLSDVDCKCVADLPGELGIDPNCQLHGAGAAIYITTGDNHSLSSGGDWSIGSSSSFRALPATTAFNPNLIVGYQGTFGSFGGGNAVGGGSAGKQKKSHQKGANVIAANILQLNQSIVSQRQKKRSRSSKSEKDTKSASKPCSYFLEGGCHRSDCKFSHDLANIPCRFFAEGGCFKSIFCPFKHAIPTEAVGSQAEVSNVGSKTSTESSEDLQIAGEKSCGSSESISAEMSSARENSESDYCWQPVLASKGAPEVQWPEMPLVAETAAKPKGSKRRRCKTRSKKNPPNLKDNMEFPILPNDVAETKEDEIEDAAAHLRLSSIYPTEGFVNFNDVAVM
ncbi:uncharacterized protein LOC142344720 isoform X1 [Convolutriloba macropyga]|uniref:uncharacterized protein LOC142344720 isoform X1 n=1 Tax=Convolutriloba macropyga TaxID=536237 RepID=UPI003F52301A